MKDTPVQVQGCWSCGTALGADGCPYHGPQAVEVNDPPCEPIEVIQLRAENTRLLGWLDAIAHKGCAGDEMDWLEQCWQFAQFAIEGRALDPKEEK